MLNKNQSKKRNSWKLYVVVPALAAFAILFQVEVIAKEKKENVKEINGKNGSVDVYKISKTTSDQELKDMAEKMKLNHNVDATVSDVVRNSNNELTAIRFDLKRGSEQSQSYRVKGSTAIKSCEIIIETENDGSKKIGLKTENENGEVKVTKGQVKVTNKECKVEVNKVENSNINSDVKTTNNTNTNISTSTSTSAANADVNVNINTNVKKGVTVNIKNDPQMHTNVSIARSGDKNTQAKPLVIVNGEIVYDADINDMDSENIKSVHVYKDSEASKKYGEDGKNGVILIQTK